VPQDFVGNRALSRDDERIVEGVDEHHSRLRDKSVAVGLCFGIGVADERNLRAKGAHGVHLYQGRRLRHDDKRAEAQLTGSVRHALRVIACARGNDTARLLR